MTEKKDSKKKGDIDPDEVINTATSAAGGVPKPIIDAATKPKPPVKPKPLDDPQPPEPENAGGTVDITKKKKTN